MTIFYWCKECGRPSDAASQCPHCMARGQQVRSERQLSYKWRMVNEMVRRDARKAELLKQVTEDPHQVYHGRLERPVQKNLF